MESTVAYHFFLGDSLNFLLQNFLVFFDINKYGDVKCFHVETQQGTLATALSFCMISWTVAERGPTYPAMFTPLRLIFVAIGETVFLDEALTVGG